MDLSSYSNPEFSRGACAAREGLWLLVSGVLVSSWIPGSSWRVLLLRMFGAEIGEGVVVKPGVKIKFPWRLHIGEHSWIGENVWIDNLAGVRIGRSACISQGAYLCTGSHDWKSPTFRLIVNGIEVADRAWIGAYAKVVPGTRVGTGTVVQMGCTVSGELLPWHVYQVETARAKKKRIIERPMGRADS